MRLIFQFEPSEIAAIKSIVDERVGLGRRMVVYRIENNVSGPVPRPNQDDLWYAHLGCLLTSQQRSGPNSPINRLLYRKPFPLSLSVCRTAEDLFSLAQKNIRQVGGIRFTNKLPHQIVDNLDYLEKQGGWERLIDWRDQLLAIRSQPPDPDAYQIETQAARHVSQNLKGFGPKQSRNFWQSLGLTRYSFLLDSRIIGWLHKHLDFPRGLLTPQGLSDEDFYLFISDILMDFCHQAKILPCVFDAAVFDSFDQGEWDQEIPF